MVWNNKKSDSREKPLQEKLQILWSLSNIVDSRQLEEFSAVSILWERDVILSGIVFFSPSIQSSFLFIGQTKECPSSHYNHQKTITITIFCVYNIKKEAFKKYSKEEICYNHLQKILRPIDSSEYHQRNFMLPIKKRGGCRDCKLFLLLPMDVHRIINYLIPLVPMTAAPSS